MKKGIWIILFLILIGAPDIAKAQRGCCSRHGGVTGCNTDGKQICADGTLSPSCTCVPPITHIYGCTDRNAKNYNSAADIEDGSCIYPKKGCMNKKATNYDVTAEVDDGSCILPIYGCMDKNAKNYNENANVSDNSCIYSKKGCTDKKAINYDKKAETDDGSCVYKKGKK